MIHKYIPETDNVFVCDNGRVFRVIEDGCELDYTVRINNSGYGRVCIKIGNRFKEKLVHRLVAEAFIKLHPVRKLVNHIDGDKLNNHMSNLEWVTQSQNMKHYHKLKNKIMLDKHKRL